MRRILRGFTLRQEEKRLEDSLSDVSDSLLEEVIDNTKKSSPNIFCPNSGRQVYVSRLSASQEQLTISAPTGEVELAIRLTRQGPVLQFSGESIELSADNNITLKCNHFELCAEEGVDIKSGGDFNQIIKGDRCDKTDGSFSNIAKKHAVEASLGDIKLKANDDVYLDGERVYLNK